MAGRSGISAYDLFEAADSTTAAKDATWTDVVISTPQLMMVSEFNLSMAQVHSHFGSVASAFLDSYARPIFRNASLALNSSSDDRR